MNHNCQGDQAEGLGQTTQPSLCVAGCGFFANPACNNMCSKCYRDAQLSKERKAANSKAVSLSEVAQLPDIKEALAPEKLGEAPQIFATPSPTPAQPAAEASTPSEQLLPAPKPEIASTSADPEPVARPVQKNPGRCFVCNKKIGLTGFKCRCDYVFCGTHRLAEAHECSFDYKHLGRQRLAESNPLIQASKMDKM